MVTLYQIHVTLPCANARRELWAKGIRHTAGRLQLVVWRCIYSLNGTRVALVWLLTLRLEINFYMASTRATFRFLNYLENDLI